MIQHSISHRPNDIARPHDVSVRPWVRCAVGGEQVFLEVVEVCFEGDAEVGFEGGDVAGPMRKP